MEKKSIKVDELKIGIYVELPMSWMEHSFLRKKFLITKEKQIKNIQDTGVKEVLYVPEKSTCKPLKQTEEPQEKPQPVAVEAVETAPEEITAKTPDPVEEPEIDPVEAKQKQFRKSIQAATKTYSESCKKINNVMKTMTHNPVKAARESQEYIHNLLEITNSSETTMHLIEGSATANAGNHHAINVSMLAMMLGRELGLKPRLVEDLGLGALLHDVGKMRLPDEIRLKKTSKLNAVQKKAYQKHIELGVDVVKNIPGFPKNAIAIIEQHHEFIDGSGFPNKLKGNEISQLSQVTTLCNIYDKLVNSNHVDTRLTAFEVMSYMYQKFSKKINPALMQTFVKTVGIYPPGTIVKLTDKQIGVVSSVNATDLLNPNVLVYNKDIPRRDAEILDLAGNPELSVADTLRRDELDDEILDYLRMTHNIGFQVQRD